MSLPILRDRHSEFGDEFFEWISVDYHFTFNRDKDDGKCRGMSIDFSGGNIIVRVEQTVGHTTMVTAYVSYMGGLGSAGRCYPGSSLAGFRGRERSS